MIDSAKLLADLKRVLKTLEDDLRVRAEDETTPWGGRLRDEHRRAQARERTGLPWIQWRDGEVSQAAVAWIIATVFIRFAEDNYLLVGAKLDGTRASVPWIAAPGEGLERAIENEAAFYVAAPTMTSRDWLERAFRTLAALPAGRPLVDPDHSPVWHAPISARTADALLVFFRRTTPDGALVHDFNDADLGTRFLGDLYQDLSDYAKETYALLQTPVFIEEFILDHTLTPAIAEFGLTGLKLIDPTCGSGHFLLGAFERLAAAWAVTAPGVERGERVQRALDSIYGVDINAFAVAIARFRLTVAALMASGLRSLVDAPAFRYHLAIGDSLLGGGAHQQAFDFSDDEEFEYSVEDLQLHHDILKPAQYNVVVGNPPYISVRDAVLRERYKERYASCVGLWTLVVPFMELFFRLALPAVNGHPAGYMGQITSNNFMKRSFGKTVIETFLSGSDPSTRVDLTHIVDTSGVVIPGHGTPTVILVGRRRRPLESTLKAVLGVRGEPSPAKGLVWREIEQHLEDDSFDGRFVTVCTEARSRFANHPWSLAGGNAEDLLRTIENAAESLLQDVALRIGYFGDTHADDAFFTTRSVAKRVAEDAAFRELAVGGAIRDYQIHPLTTVIFPYDDLHSLRPLSALPGAAKLLWPLRTELGNRTTTRGTYFVAGRKWHEWHQLPPDRGASRFAIAYAEVATHNHFVLDRKHRAFARTAPVIKLPIEASEQDHLELLALLNTSTAAFWIRQVAYRKGGSEESWADRFQVNGTSLGRFPLPHQAPASTAIARELVRRAETLEMSNPFNLPHEVLGDPVARAEMRTQYETALRESIALQEELDWAAYASYGLAGQSLAPTNPEIVPIDPNERSFEVRLARRIANGDEESEWFARHSRPALLEPPSGGSTAWRSLWRARYEAAEAGFIGMLERPEHKRRWGGGDWEELSRGAAVEALLDRLETSTVWHDAAGRPMVRSVAQLADELRHDQLFRELLKLRTGSQDYDLTAEVGKLLAGEAVPGLAALRYKPSGLEKFRAWERTWELQRAEDRGERVDVPVPPKYGPTDFVKPSYWSARGKLDVPKERFISVPGSKLPDDTTEVYGWAGWDHGERGQAFARLANDLSRAGASDEQVIPVVGVLLELEPWLKQWHDDIDERSGVSPAAAVAGVTTALLGRLGLGRDQIIAWRPPAPTRGRRSAS